jgi:hypothetical protein
MTCPRFPSVVGVQIKFVIFPPHTRGHLPFVVENCYISIMAY